jgi:hypothetical protein
VVYKENPNAQYKIVRFLLCSFQIQEVKRIGFESCIAKNAFWGCGGQVPHEKILTAAL